jgi:hypothetical protein
MEYKTNAEALAALVQRKAMCCAIYVLFWATAAGDTVNFQAVAQLKDADCKSSYLFGSHTLII